jgi:hypothetical protein
MTRAPPLTEKGTIIKGRHSAEEKEGGEPITPKGIYNTHSKHQKWI